MKNCKSRHYKQGRFKPKFPEKYRGDVTNVIYRSGLELSVMKYLDEKDEILEWSSEECVVPYMDRTTGRVRRYFPDFVIKAVQKDGSIQTTMIEVKPSQQVSEPKKQQKATKRYITEVTTYATNLSKWEAARDYCRKKGWKFQIITEKDIHGK